MARRSDAEIFLDQLTEAYDERGAPVSNIALRRSLGWVEHRYDRAWETLLGEGKITRGKGKGGTVSPSDAKKSKEPLSIFIAYSHADESLKNDLLAHLDPLRRVGLISIWHDRKLVAGDDWKKSIGDSLEGADVILLLVSANFLTSDFCYSKEMKRAVEMHKGGEVVVVPVILRPCDWKHAEFAILDIQALPTDAKPVTRWENQDEAFLDIAEKLKPLLERLRH